ncbi:hypothetical protein JTB14_001905 [Gonioctena quinquepunctata]|nr:hypothetical protein JTB14_001905 [Gonioctena quinquepunctata]
MDELTNKDMQVIIYVDNQSATKLIKSGQMNRNSKYIDDVCYHFISEQLKEGWFETKYCSTEDQIADILTEPLLNVKFDYFKNKMCSIP